MYSDQPQCKKEAGRNFSHQWRVQPQPPDRGNGQTTENPNRVAQTSQKVLAGNEKQHKKVVEVGLRDQEVSGMLAEVARLQKSIHVNTIGLSNAKVKITRQRQYIHEMLETIRLLYVKNMAVRGEISQLGGLRKENEKQKKRILELAHYCKNYEELVLLVSEAEAMNKSLKLMLYTEADGLSMNLKSVNDQRIVFARTKRDHVNEGGPQSLIDALSPQTRMNIQQAFDLKNLQPASTIQAESHLGDYLAAVE